MDMDLQFPADAEEARVHSRRNISDTERWVSVAAGTLMAVYGVSRRRGNGWLLATMGALLVRRGVTGHCHTYDLIGVNTAGTGEDTRRVLGGPGGVMIDEMKRTTKVQRDIKIPDIFYLSFVKKANDEIKASGWKP